MDPRAGMIPEPTELELRELIAEIAGSLVRALRVADPSGSLHFVLWLYSVDDSGGFLSSVTNGRRADVINVLRSTLEKMERIAREQGGH
jgi:hypothetical protein